jgi:serine/threonine-protein kinase RsbT
VQERRLPVCTRSDADQARREARRLAAALGFGRVDAEEVALAVSELAMNLHRYAVGGEIVLRPIQEDAPISEDAPTAVAAVGGRGGRRGLEIVSLDAGPGIADPERALQDGYTTGGGLGSGLPAARRLVDEFTLVTDPSGTRIVAIKWLTHRSPSA